MVTRDNQRDEADQLVLGGDLALVHPGVFLGHVLDEQVPVRDVAGLLVVLDHHVVASRPRERAHGQEVLVLSVHATPRHLPRTERGVGLNVCY